MAFDYKKEYKEFYLPSAKPQIVSVPEMQFVSVSGTGNPNDEDGEYKKALAVLYAISYTIKMSKMGDYRIDGYFDYVVPPLEGFWWQESASAKSNSDAATDVPPAFGIDYAPKEDFCWISLHDEISALLAPCNTDGEKRRKRYGKISGYCWSGTD